MFKVLGIAVVVGGLMVSPVWADSSHGGDASANANASAVGVGVGIGGGASVTNSNTNSNTNVGINSQSQGQHQGQSQRQSQGQGQIQGQNNGQQISPSQSVKVDAPLVPGVAVAPGLAAGGSQVCLGSFSVGLSGPMAGVAFGKTVIDKGCERRQNAILLFNMGYKTEALELLKGDEGVRALFVAPGAKTAAVEAPTSPVVATVPTARVVEVQGN